VAIRHALELCRSLAAHVWDNTASQLRQIDGLGEVAVRKLASASIKTIDSLINTEPSKIELVLGKNPPFGLGLLKKLDGFPNLRVSVKEISREIKHGKGSTIRFKAEVGFLNDVVPQFFNKRPVYVCFLAETSDGRLIEFRRMGTKHLQNGEEILLSVDLVKPTHRLCCFVMCDEVAGTCKYAELNIVGVPDTIYPLHQSSHSGARNGGLRSRCDMNQHDPFGDEFGDGGIEDKDLLSLEMDVDRVEVVEDIDDLLAKEAKQQKRQAITPSKQSNGDSEDEDTAVATFKEPTKLRNGRWTCQHDCNDKGRKCKHKCCREGVVKPKRRPKDVDNGQRRITDLGTIKTKTGNSSQKSKGLNLHASVFGDEASSAPVGARKRSSEPPHKKPKLSHCQKGDDPHARCDESQLEEQKASGDSSLRQTREQNGKKEPGSSLDDSAPQPNLDFLLDDTTALDCD